MTEKNTNKKTKTDSDTDSKALGHGRQGGVTNCSINEFVRQNLIKTRDHYCSYIRRDLSPSGAPMKCCPAGTSFASFSFQPGTQCSLILYLILSSTSPLPCFLPCFIRLSPWMEADLHWEPESFASTWICLHPPGPPAPPAPPGPGPPESAFSHLVHLVHMVLRAPTGGY